MKNKHTPEPWHMRLSDNATPHIEHGDCYLDDVGESRNRICVMPAEISQSFNSFQNARRIVACVNACAGIRTEALEHRRHLLQAGDDQIVELSKQRDELQEEVNALKERAEYDLAEFARTLDTSYAEIKLLKNQRDVLLAALEFYADGHHFILHDANAWETVSGEPQNFQEDDANTATVEDGSVARAAIASVKGGAA